MPPPPAAPPPFPIRPTSYGKTSIGTNALSRYSPLLLCKRKRKWLWLLMGSQLACEQRLGDLGGCFRLAFPSNARHGSGVHLPRNFPKTRRLLRRNFEGTVRHARLAAVCFLVGRSKWEKLERRLGSATRKL